MVKVWLRGKGVLVAALLSAACTLPDRNLPPSGRFAEKATVPTATVNPCRTLLPVTGLPAPGQVSVAAVPADGRVCVRVGNGTTEPLRYDASYFTSLRLDRRNWLGLWDVQDTGRSYFIGTDFYGHDPAPESLEPLAAGEFFYDHIPYRRYALLPRGRYRACFRFLPGRQTKWRERCSAPFRLPQPVDNRLYPDFSSFGNRGDDLLTKPNRLY